MVSTAQTSIALGASERTDTNCIIAHFPTRVNAALSGTVTEVDEDEISGIYIVIEHEDGFKTLYAHLKKAHVREGAAVKAGQKIASSGNTGKTTGPHLHFSMLKDDGYLHPALYVDV